MIYLDNNATTRIDPRVRDAMLPWLGDHYGNPSSMHRFGQEARQAIEHARHQVATLIRCEPRELLFTSGGTEADNAAIHGLLAARPSRKLIVTSTVEHSAIREPLAALKKNGYEIIETPVDSLGRLNMQSLADTLNRRAADIALATFMWANNETGILFDVAAIGALCREHNIPFHVDAIQAVGKMPVDLRTLPIDLLSVSGHKFHAPKGVGALFVRRAARWQPFIRGGPQERERRGGTENVAGIVAMGLAAELAQQDLEGPTENNIATLRDRLESNTLKRIPTAHANGDPTARLANTTNIGFAGLEAEAILLLLSERDICASAGAACASGSLEPSHVLRAMSLPDPIAHGSVRFSLSKWTTTTEIDEAVDRIAEVIERLKATLPA